MQQLVIFINIARRKDNQMGDNFTEETNNFTEEGNIVENKQENGHVNLPSAYWLEILRKLSISFQLRLMYTLGVYYDLCLGGKAYLYRGQTVTL